MTEVWIPYHQATLDGRIHHDIWYWIEQRAGPIRWIENPQGKWHSRHSYGEDGSEFYVFSFQDVKLAILFKLTFG